MRTVLPAASLAMLVAKQSWLAGVLAVSGAKSWGEQIVVARPRCEAPGHCTATESQQPILGVQTFCSAIQPEAITTVYPTSFGAKASYTALLVSKRPFLEASAARAHNAAKKCCLIQFFQNK